MKKEFIFKVHEASLVPFGCYPGARPIKDLIKNGIIILDKPPGPTSHQVDSLIKKILGIKKCSHGGTLDPRVSGVMLVALENSTKLMPILLGSDKEYVALMHLHKDVPEDILRKKIKEFEGEIEQIPPQKSAVSRKKRKRKIYSIEILEIDGRDILFKVKCEAGTYIRKLCDDIGKSLGIGAHMQELRRIKSGAFDESQAVKLHDVFYAAQLLKEGDEEKIREIIKPLEIVENQTKNVIVKDSSIGAICNGAPLGVGGIVAVEKGIKNGDIVSMISLKGELVAIGKAKMDYKDMLRLKRGLAVKTDRVIMKKGTYPVWKK